MLKSILVLIFCTILFRFSNAQTVLNDSVSTEAGNAKMVFYQLQSGQKTIASNTDWHFALSVRPSAFPSNTLQGTTIRINEALGVKVYQIPAFTADSFGVVVDTLGFHQWLQLHDSDSLLDRGALNTGLNIGVFNYGWGVYGGPPNHNVEGNKVFLYQLPSGETGKFLVEKLDRDTAWDVKFANLDNSNTRQVHISKNKYNGKNLVYLNLATSNVYDKEPLSDSWDLQFLKYAATDVFPDSTFAVVGTFVNKGVTVATCFPVSKNITSATAPFVSDMDEIGWNWKEFDYQNNVYAMRDSLVYFIKTRGGQNFKLIFSDYSGSSSGNIFFQTEQANVGIAEAGLSPQVTLFPNPANGSLQIQSEEEANFFVADMSGRIVYQTSNKQKVFTLPTSEFSSGTYFLGVKDDLQVVWKKFTVLH